jgi:hypothetical protein
MILGGYVTYYYRPRARAQEPGSLIASNHIIFCEQFKYILLLSVFSDQILTQTTLNCNTSTGRHILEGPATLPFGQNPRPISQVQLKIRQTLKSPQMPVPDRALQQPPPRNFQARREVFRALEKAFATR